MNRDPRFARMQNKDRAAEPPQLPPQPKQLPQQLPPQPKQPSPAAQPDDAEKEKDKRILEMDLSIFGALELPAFKETEDDDGEDRMGLPFKPHRLQPVAKEIDASIYSHPLLEYKLRALELNKPDYSGVVASLPVSRVQQDPRLRRFAKKRPLPLEPSVMAAASMEPKPVVVERPSDPRRKAASAAPVQSSPQQSPSEATKPSSVYNPKNDLYSSKPRTDPRGPVAEVYSPSQDVQDMYGPYNKRAQPAQAGSYNPRDERPADGYDEWNSRQYGNGRNWGPDAGAQGGSNSWGGPDQGYYNDNSGENGGYYNDFDPYNGQSGQQGGMGRGLHRGGPVRNADPRAQHRDPRRRD
jgi:hypothetical protein